MDRSMTTAAIRCCQCAATSGRCGGSPDDVCECAVAARPCAIDCESVHLAADCLNQATTACRCGPNVDKLDQGNKRTGSFKRKGQQQLSTSAEACPAPWCECRIYGERCNERCGCQANCRQADKTTTTTTTTMKVERPSKGCKCSSGKKGCVKSAKCPCRAAMQHCQADCKCQRDCCNSLAKATLTKVGRALFLDPEQDANAAVLFLIGANNYKFRVEVLDDEKTGEHASEVLCRQLVKAVETYHYSELRHICIYLSKSPCFHQDCEPRCEILQDCDVQRACARRLAVTYAQVKRHLGTVDLAMTVKFLTPYVKRGDLYLQQGLLTMMKTGIIVEPMVMKEWIDMMHETQEDVTNALARIWVEHNLDNHVRQSQHYVNTCRQAIGLNDIYWTGAFHDALKMTAVTCEQTLKRLSTLSARFTKAAVIREGTLRPSKSLVGLAAGKESKTRKLQKEQRQSGMSVSLDVRMPDDDDDDPIQQMQRQMDDASDSTGMYATVGAKESSSTNAHRNRSSSAKEAKRPTSNPAIARNGDGSALRMLQSESTDPLSSYIDAPVPWEPKSAQDSGIEATATSTVATSSHATGSLFERSDTLATPPVVGDDWLPPRPIDIARVVLGLSGRPMDDRERQEVRAFVCEAIDDLHARLNSLLGYLEMQSNDTSV
uniref:CRC domain-containing protein n=1 Tax=Plectus sambesii TaxID=2011161 RepID=A0A914VHP7_9BILA